LLYHFAAFKSTRAAEAMSGLSEKPAANAQVQIPVTERGSEESRQIQTSDIEKEAVRSEGLDTESTTDAQPDLNAVDWDGSDDPAIARNWPARKKWINIGLLSSLTLLTYVLCT